MKKLLKPTKNAIKLIICNFVEGRLMKWHAEKLNKYPTTMEAALKNIDKYIMWMHSELWT